MKTSTALVLFSTLLVTTRVLTCGITTHTEIGHRAIKYLEAMGTDKYEIDYLSIIKKHPGAYMAGAPFPDTFYNGMCEKGKLHSIAEDTHWVPWMIEAVKHVQNMPKPLSEHNEKVIAFLFGVATHSMADISWHGLGVSLGFLRAMGYTDYHGVWEDGHGDGDFGGDVVAAYELDLSFMKTLQWWVPTDDLLQIYEKYYPNNNPVTAGAIRLCTSYMYAGRVGERGFVSAAYPTYGKKSAFLLEQYQDYPIGGVDDMAIWSAKYYNTVMKWFEGKCSLSQDNNPVNVHCDDAEQMAQQMSSARLSGTPPSEKVFTATNIDNVIVEDAGEGAVVMRDKPSTGFDVAAAAGKFLQGLSASPMESSDHKVASIFGGKKPSAVFNTETDYSRLGAAVVSGDFNGDGVADVAAGAPTYSGSNGAQTGRVYISYGSKESKYAKVNSIEKSSDVHIDGKQYYRCGTALAVVDMNADGFDDVAVSCPTVGGLDLGYTGIVQVFFGSKDGLSTAAGYTIQSNSKYHNLGWKLASGDIDADGHDDLVIGSQFYKGSRGNMAGQVAVLLTSGGKERSGEVDIKNAADWASEGSMDFAWYGSHVSVEKAGDRRLLLVGAVTTRRCARNNCSYSKDDVQSVGQLFGYDYDPETKALKQTFSILGNNETDKVGHDASIGAPFGKEKGYFLALSAPTMSVEHTFAWFIKSTMDQAGQVVLVPLKDLQGDMEYSALKPALTLKGDRHQGRLGWSLTFADANGDGVDDLLVSSPVRTPEPTSLVFSPRGQVYVWYGGSKFPTGSIQSCGDHAHEELYTGSANDRFGETLCVADTTGRGKPSIIVGNPVSDHGARHGGGVNVFTF